MLKYSLAATAVLVAGLTACLEDSTGPDCTAPSITIVETRGDTIVTSTGLRYIEVTDGASNQQATWCSGAAIQYVGTFLNGEEFDDGEFAFTPGVSNIIPGFAEGVVGMRVDGTRRVIVPPNLGYGEDDYPPTGAVVIPGNSTLVFEIKLIAVE